MTGMVVAYWPCLLTFVGDLCGINHRTPVFASGETMKLVSAVIKPFKLDEVREALSGMGAVKKATRNSTAVLNMWSIFCPK